MFVSPSPYARRGHPVVTWLLIAILLLTACTPTSSIPSSRSATSAAQDRLIFGVAEEPDTLDPHKTTAAIASDIMSWIGASLVAIDPQGKVVPYLAERWEASADGLVWTFYLKDDVHFHDGTPFTAQDYVYTFERARTPETASPVAGSLLGSVQTIGAPDDRTLVLTLGEPFFPLLTNLAASGYLMPLQKKAVEAGEVEHGRSPVSVGPYRVQSWNTGESIVLERNPDFTWGPAFLAAGAPKIQVIEYRFLPDPATRLAALETGEIDISTVDGKDSDLIRQNEQFELFEAPLPGASPMGAINASAPPFDDVRVRHAFSLAVNRRALIQAVQQGHATPQWGPISASVLGYWSGVEQEGDGFDLDAAKRLLDEADYTLDTRGMRQKAGEPLHISLSTPSDFVRDAEMLKEQWTALGAEVTIDLLEQSNLAFDRIVQKDYQFILISIIYSEADILYLLYHSSKGALPLGSHLADPELDQLLDRTRTTVDVAQRQEWVNQVQARIVEQAFMLPLYTPILYTAVNRRIQGVEIGVNGVLFYENAYFAQP